MTTLLETFTDEKKEELKQQPINGQTNPFIDPNAAVSLNDFFAHMPSGKYIFVPTGET